MKYCQRKRKVHGKKKQLEISENASLDFIKKWAKCRSKGKVARLGQCGDENMSKSGSGKR